MAINDGGAAFPCEQGLTPAGVWNPSFEAGMSLRDYFAAKSMSALVGYSDRADVAKYAYAMADAMLAERAKAEGND